MKTVTDYCAEVIKVLQERWETVGKRGIVPSLSEMSFYVAPSVWFWVAEPDKLPPSFRDLHNFRAYKLPCIIVSAQGNLRDIVFGGMAWDITMRLYVMIEGVPNPTTLSQVTNICEHIITILIREVNRTEFWSTITPTMHRPVELFSPDSGMMGITAAVIECKVAGLPLPIWS